MTTPPYRLDSVRTRARQAALAATLAVCGSLALAAGAFAALPDSRGYELVSPVQKNGVAPYAATPAPNGGAVDFQARGAFAGATSGSLNLYQAVRTAGGWQTKSLTPTPTTPLGALEEQAPLWFSADLSQTIFTTPESYAAGDQDGGALSLYEQAPNGALALVSQGSQGGGEPKHATFDAATPDGKHVVFSSGASLLPTATGLDPETAPEAEYLYERDLIDGETNLLSLGPDGQPVGSVATTLPEGYAGVGGPFVVASIEGFALGQFVTIGTGPSAVTTQVYAIAIIAGKPELSVANGSGLGTSYPPGAPVVHVAEGAVLGNGANLALGSPPAGEFLPANAGSGSTTNAISQDGSTVFMEAPSPLTGLPTTLFMRQNDSTSVKIAGGTIDGQFLLNGGAFATVGSARYEGAAADGALVFFTSDEGLAGATKVHELYEFNTTSHEIGGDAPQTVHPLSTGLAGDQTPTTTLQVTAHAANETLTVASTEGFHAGEEILFAPFEPPGFALNDTEKATIASVLSPTELALTTSLTGVGKGVPAGTELHAVHPAYMVAASNDGSHVYFESNGVLASNQNGQSASAVPAQPNLYVFDTSTGETTFIATLTESDVSTDGHPTGLAGEPDISRPAVPTPNGGALAFASAANLTGQNPWQEHTEIYRYSASGNTLTCVSCTAPGVKPTGDATFGETAGGTYDPPGLSSPISEDGSRVFFQTPDSLVPEDVNGGSPPSPKFDNPTSTDVYEWEGGNVSLLSGGSASTPAVLQGTTPSGDDVLFTTTAQLVPGEGDGGYENVFDARVGGGFPEAPQAAPSCVGQQCRAAFGVAPVFGAPASAVSQSEGNFPSVVSPAPKPKPKPLVCRKGRVKKRVKGKLVCAKKARKASHAATRAGHGAHTSRAAVVNVHRSR